MNTFWDWQIGDEVAYSPVGAGRITGQTERGYPQVNEVAVATMIATDGRIFNPHKHDLDELKRVSDTGANA